VLPNAWDAASARLVEAAGFPVVATSSNAMAAVLGYEDGEQVPVDDALAYVATIARAVRVPVTADFERGFRLRPVELVERFAATGAVGFNLEDSNPSTRGMVDASAQADFLAAVRAAADTSGVDLVINARTDSFIRRAGSPDEQLAASLDRGYALPRGRRRLRLPDCGVGSRCHRWSMALRGRSTSASAAAKASLRTWPPRHHAP
jgi:2-methylisocitrate lyase-like PEP mutase family enzyme